MSFISLKLFMSFFLVCAVSKASMKELIQKTYDPEASDVESLYRHFHQHPELSGKEFKTAKKMAEEFRKLGFQVTEKIGGTGVVAVLKNGSGPVMWLRADMDGLPVTEKTKKEYSSKKKGVMHACGHDTHIAAMIGYAKVIKKLKKSWKGTVVFISQPAEEIGAGAEAMIKDGLYKRFPKPDYVLGLHVSGLHDKGKIAYTSGFALAAVDSVDIKVKGLGGHGSLPEKAIDPVLLASKMVVNMQSLVSRNIDPRDPVVLTFGSIHGGTKHNIIPDTVHLQATLRTYSKEVRKKMKDGIRRMALSLAKADGAPQPTVRFSQGLPATYNSPQMVNQMLPIFKKVVGSNNVVAQRGIMGAEDFAHYSQDGKYPSFIFFIGGAPKNKRNFGVNHNAKFAPEYKSVLNVGVQTMTMAVLELMPAK